MKAGDKIILRAYKSDGTCYRWHDSYVEKIQENCVIIVGGPGRRIHQPDGGFVAEYTIRSYLWLDKPISLLELFDEAGELLELYANINSPVVVAENEVSYTDYELDVVLKPGHSAVIVDEDEFDDAIVKFGYSKAFQQQCYQVALDAVDLVEGWSAGMMPKIDVYQ